MDGEFEPFNLNHALRGYHKNLETITVTLNQEDTSMAFTARCVHLWMVNVLNQEWDSDLAKLALKFVGSHILGRESAKWC